MSRRVEAGGLRWNVDACGAGRTLVLLHGTGGTVRTWDALTRLLAPSFHIVAIDLPGHGGTESPEFERMGCPSMAALVSSLLRAIDARPVAMIAHSAGAAIMLQLAIDGVLPHDVRLVGINPALQPLNDANRQLMRGLVGDAFRSGVARSAVRVAGHFAPLIELLLSSTGSRLTPSDEQEYVRAFTVPGHAEAAYAMMANWDVEPVLRSLPSLLHETLFIVGANDRWISPAGATQAASKLAHARVAKVADAGHLVHQERPAQVAALIATLLSSA